MRIVSKQSLFRYFVFCLTMIAVNVPAVTPGKIMNVDDVRLADAETLSAEASIFKSIGMGIALSIVQCERQDTCTAVSSNEIQQLIQTLESRIDGLILRQQENEEDLNDIIIAYVSERDNYLRYRDKLGEIIPLETEEEFEEEDIFPEEEEVFTGEVTDEVEIVEKDEVKVKEEAKEESVLIDADIDFSIFEDVEEEIE